MASTTFGSRRLVGPVDPDRDMLDMAAFAGEAGASLYLLSDAVLGKPNVSPDLVHATAL